ncbi:hypothetical protein ACO30U_001413 [Listeria monocytogenes]
MHKVSIILISDISLILLSACSGVNVDKTVNSSSSSSTSITSSTTDSSKKFDELSLKLILIADIVDSRVKEYPYLEGLTLYCFVDNSDLYLQITNNADTGHSIYKLLINDDDTTSTQDIRYLNKKDMKKTT